MVCFFLIVYFIICFYGMKKRKFHNNILEELKVIRNLREFYDFYSCYLLIASEFYLIFDGYGAGGQ